MVMESDWKTEQIQNEESKMNFHLFSMVKPFIKPAFYGLQIFRCMLFLLSLRWRETARVIFYTFLVKQIMLACIPHYNLSSDDFTELAKMFTLMMTIMVSAVDGKANFWSIIVASILINFIE